MANRYSVPSVFYIEEKNAFQHSMVSVNTAVPCFIGFTEFAKRNEQSLTNQLVKIRSINEFNQYFGGAPKTQYQVTFAESDGSIRVKPNSDTQFYLYYSLKLYFSNGGGDCYIFSTGNYGIGRLQTSMVEKALEILETNPEPTLILIPDGHTMKAAADYYGLWRLLLPHCKKMVNRFAILDIHGGGIEDNLNDAAAIDKLITQFKEGVGTDDLAYGAVYWPWVQATVVASDEVDFTNIEQFKDSVIPKIKEQFSELYPNTDGNHAIELGNFLDDLISKNENSAYVDGIGNQHKTLLQISPLYNSILTLLRDVANVLPPSGALAGIYKLVDSSVGTYQSPANISLGSVVKPMLNINSQEQESLSIPFDGKAINTIRSFPGKGVLVWGARTIDGNSQDWRYISVRRTVNMIELSIRHAAEVFVFEPNVANTWTTLEAMITNFLFNQWSAGALAGANPEDAFSVAIGLGSTMTQEDILNGILQILVKIAVNRPGEFIEINIEQQMKQS